MRRSIGPRRTRSLFLRGLPAARPAGAQGTAWWAWGNVEGVRVEGEVMPFETSVCMVNSTGAVRARTAKERQPPRFSRAGNRRTITTRLGALSISEVVEDVRPGRVRLDLTVHP